MIQTSGVAAMDQPLMLMVISPRLVTTCNWSLVLMLCSDWSIIWLLFSDWSISHLVHDNPIMSLEPWHRNCSHPNISYADFAVACPGKIFSFMPELKIFFKSHLSPWQEELLVIAIAALGNLQFFVREFVLHTPLFVDLWLNIAGDKVFRLHRRIMFGQIKGHFSHEPFEGLALELLSQCNLHRKALDYCVLIGQ